MNNLRVFLFICAAACPVLTAHGQSLVQFPKGPAEWTVAIVPGYSNGHPPYPAPSTSPELQIKKIDITKVDGVSRALLTWGDGRTTERWGYDQYHFMILTETYNGQPTFASDLDIQPGGAYYVGFDASSFAWLEPKCLKDTVVYQHKKCYHYQGTVPIQVFKFSNTNRVVAGIDLFCEAWIDQDTLLPVALYDGSMLGVFTFHDPPTTPVTPPPKVQAALQHFIAAATPLR
jgi:hypothetical protein